MLSSEIFQTFLTKIYDQNLRSNIIKYDKISPKGDFLFDKLLCRVPLCFDAPMNIGLSDSQIMLNLSQSVGLEDDQYLFSGGWVGRAFTNIELDIARGIRT